MQIVNSAVLERWIAFSDEQVVSQILAGQTALFEVLMRRHNERLYRAARAILRDDAEAEDVMQQAYVNAYVHLRQFNGRSAFATCARAALRRDLSKRIGTAAAKSFEFVRPRCDRVVQAVLTRISG